MSIDPFSTKTARDWLFRGARASKIGIEDISVIGSGPFAAADFGAFVRRARAEVLTPNAYTEVLVLGEFGWTEKELQRLLRLRSRRTLRVYSQQMFQMYLLSGNDPLNSAAIANRLGKGHPGLDYLKSVGFEWPSIDVIGFGPSSANTSAWRSQGFLKALNYSVHRAVSAGARSRRVALGNAFRARVPKRFGAEYIAYWGSAKSSLRLERMAHSIARFYRMASGRQTRDLSEACKCWESDLSWLKRQFYRGGVRFRWPSIEVQ